MPILIYLYSSSFMSSKAIIIKDFNKSHQAIRQELRGRKKKLLLTSPIREIVQVGYTIKILSHYSLARVNRRCFYTGRKKGLVRLVKMTRMYFKDTIFKGLVVGLRKSAW